MHQHTIPQLTRTHNAPRNLPNFSEIEQSAVVLLRFKYVSNLAPLPSWIWLKVDFDNSGPLRTHKALMTKLQRNMTSCG